MVEVEKGSAKALATLLFVDDHPLYRMGFELALARAIPDVSVTAVASAEEAYGALASSCDVDLCLADYRLAETDGLSFLIEVGRRWPTVARGILASESLPVVAGRAREMGLVAFLSKARDMDALAQAVRRLFDGTEVFDCDPADPGARLSDRRRRILELAAGGRTNKEIAITLAITERTVKDHWADIFGQLEVANRAEAVSRAHQLRLIG